MAWSPRSRRVPGRSSTSRYGYVSFPKIRASATKRSSMPPRPIDRERRLAAAKREGLHDPGQPEGVVCVEVREEDLVGGPRGRRRAEELALRAFAQSKSRRSPPAAEEARRRRRAVGTEPGRAQEDEVEVQRASKRPRTRLGKLQARIPGNERPGLEAVRATRSRQIASRGSPRTRGTAIAQSVSPGSTTYTVSGPGTARRPGPGEGAPKPRTAITASNTVPPRNEHMFA